MASDTLSEAVADLRRCLAATKLSPREATLLERIRYDQAYRNLCEDLAPALADAWERAVATIAERDAEIARLREEVRDLSPQPPCEEHEAIAARFRAEQLKGDGKPEGTRESLERCARMLDTYGPDCFPANEKGQVHFARAMMESVADEIRAYLSADALKGVTHDE